MFQSQVQSLAIHKYTKKIKFSLQRQTFKVTQSGKMLVLIRNPLSVLKVVTA